jgi:hypothetical protein
MGEPRAAGPGPPPPGAARTRRAHALAPGVRTAPWASRPRTGNEHIRPSAAVAATLAAILVLAAVVRLWRLGALGANSDEAVYAGQAASIAGVHALEPLFPVFRAHPLLFQTLLSIPYRIGAGLETARAISALLGVTTVYMTFRLGRLLYGSAAGLAAALFLAVMPYHVVVTRQVLLDGPMVLCATAALYLVARFAATARREWLYAAAAMMGLTVLCKETSILLVGAVYVFFALAPEVRLPLRAAAIAGAVLAVVAVQFPLVIRLAGASRSGGHYLAWQLFRRPNHGWGFYPSVVPRDIGPLLLAGAAAGLLMLRRERSWREALLLSWILVPAAFFELWPVKGYQYLLPVAPAVAVLAGRAVARWPAGLPRLTARRLPRRPAIAIPAVLVAGSLLAGTWQRVSPSPSASLLAGAGGVPAGREAGTWIAGHVPEGAELMTIGPSMANILAFYGGHRSYALSVSPNPLNRNPSYTPLPNPDFAVRNGEVQYAVWDAFSASRSPFFARRLVRYVERYRGRLVHQETLVMRTADGRSARRPAIAIYVMRP